MVHLMRPLALALALLCGLSAAAADTRPIATDGPVHIRVRASGERVWTRLRALADLSERIARAPDLVLTDRLPRAVAGGVQRGYLVEVRLVSTVDRAEGHRRLRCVMHQSIFELKTMALRGSASQRGTLALSPGADDAALSRARQRCFGALVPAVLDGVDDFLARSPR